MIFLEFHANHGIETEVETCRVVFEKCGATGFDVGAGEEMEALWEARRDLAPAMEAYDPPRRPVKPGDVTVPISDYPTMVRFAKDEATKYGLDVLCFGHAGDGNVHYNVLVDLDDPDERAAGKAVSDAIVERAIELGGTSTGEHGVGQGKREYLVAEHGETWRRGDARRSSARSTRRTR